MALYDSAGGGAAVGKPLEGDAAEGSRFHGGAGELSGVNPVKGDPTFLGLYWSRRVGVGYVQRIDEIDFGMVFAAVLDEAVFAHPQEGDGIGCEASLFQDLALKRGGALFAKFDVPAGEVEVPGLPPAAEENLAAFHAYPACDCLDAIHTQLL